jgi:hypothetical protein
VIIMNKDAARLKENIGELISYYTEIDEVGHERFLNMFHDKLDEMITYHNQQIDKLRGLKERLVGNNSTSLDSITFNNWPNPDKIDLGTIISGAQASDTINFVGDDYPHTDLYWDTNRNK